MRILISNDDGIHAAGLLSLCREMVKLGEVVVVAPSGQRSASSHAMSIGRELKVEKVNLLPEIKESYALEGTPTDCTKWALEYLVRDAMPDIVLSGINHGSNIGSDVMYSGTVAAATEGWMLGIPSLAVSLASNKPELDFTYTAQVARRLVAWWANENFLPAGFLNLNVPDLPQEKITGIRICPVGKRIYHNIFTRTVEDDGCEHYVLAGTPYDDLNEDDGSDVYSVLHGYITLSPICPDYNEGTAQMMSLLQAKQISLL